MHFYYLHTCSSSVNKINKNNKSLVVNTSKLASIKASDKIFTSTAVLLICLNNFYRSLFCIKIMLSYSTKFNQKSTNILFNLKPSFKYAIYSSFRKSFMIGLWKVYYILNLRSFTKLHSSRQKGLMCMK